jgi:hypothetical protein
MALDDQKISLSKLLAKLQENRLAIKSITKLSELNAGKAGRTQALTQSLLINSGSAIGATVIQVFFATGLTDLPLTALATINIWNIAKPYFSNTKLKSLMDKKLNFVVKNDNSTLRDFYQKDPNTLKKDLPEDTISPEFGNQVPDPITLDVLLEMFKNGKSANYLKLKNSANLPHDKYIDLSPESKALFIEIRKELGAIEKTPGWWSFVKNNQQYLAGAAAGYAQFRAMSGQKAKEEKVKEEAVSSAIKKKEEKRNSPPPNNSFKRVIHDPKKFGG